MEWRINMIDLKKLLKIHDKVTSGARSLVEPKGHDYNGKTGDALFNLRVPKLIGICDDSVQVCLILASNKLMRLSSLRNKDPAVKGETFSDSVEDSINYLIYSLAFYMEKKND